MEGTNRTENHAFIVMARHLRSKGLPVPEVYWVSEDEMSYTQEDLGDTLLFDYISHGRTTGKFSEDEKSMLRQTIRTLAHIQIEGAEGMDWSVSYPVACFDRRSIFWDLNYFKYDFLKLYGVEFDEAPLEDDFERLADRLLAVPCDVFMYRDAQSRNVMIRDGKPYFIDFQGGRRGPIYYDLASFLWQAKANYPKELREELVEDYWKELSVISGKWKVEGGKFSDFRARLNEFVLFRMLQVLGAYGFRGLHGGKRHFVESIPFAIRNLKALFEDVTELREAFPAIYKIVDSLASSVKSIEPRAKSQALTVTV